MSYLLLEWFVVSRMGEEKRKEKPFVLLNFWGIDLGPVTPLRTVVSAFRSPDGRNLSCFQQLLTGKVKTYLEKLSF